MIPEIVSFIEAVDAKDLPRAEAALKKVQDASVAGKWGMNTLTEGEHESLINAALEFSRLENCGPVVEDPDALIEDIHAALDDGDADRARKNMRAFRGSQASGGPWPSESGKNRLIEALRRKEWEL